RPISRDRIVDLLLQAHGVGLLEQMIVLQGAERELAARGLAITQEDIEAEYDRGLRRMLSPLPAQEPAGLDRAAGERVLERLLSTRNISRDEYLMGMRRNACLRKIVGHELHLTEAQLEAEFERAHGERVKVRHIQMATFAEVDRIKRRLDAGEMFADLARNYSANPNTAPSGGLLRVFSRDDEDVPELMRKTAFGMPVGAHSAPVKIEQWYHLLTVEQRYPAREARFDDVRAELSDQLRERLTEPAMEQLQQTLLHQAEVEVLDPVLAGEFRRKREVLTSRSP
ncbi:MAG: hypothetical protein GY842_19675, partial [bacterium]|nr:hypothetical protein [bacterium]